jgi:hypothetical protein
MRLVDHEKGRCALGEAVALFLAADEEPLRRTSLYAARANME